jgi:hypothetical protein
MKTVIYYVYTYIHTYTHKHMYRYPVGGRQRPTRAGIKNIRMNRDLVEGMVLTVEPGIYFIEVLIEDALQVGANLRFSL